MSTLRVETNKGAKVEFSLGRKGVIKRDAKDGIAVVTGLDINDSPVVTVYMDGYVTKEKKVAPMKCDMTIQVALEKIKPVEQVATEAVVEAVAPVVIGVIPKLVTMKVTNIDEAKQNFKELESYIKSQKELVESSLKKGAYSTAQSAGAELMNVARTQLNKSMEYYVNLRSDLNPFGSWVNFRNYTEYTSMIAAIYFLRQNLVTWYDEILKKLATI